MNEMVQHPSPRVQTNQPTNPTSEQASQPTGPPTLTWLPRFPPLGWPSQLGIWGITSQIMAANLGIFGVHNFCARSDHSGRAGLMVHGPTTGLLQW